MTIRSYLYIRVEIGVVPTFRACTALYLTIMLFIFSRHQLEDDESKINHKMHLQVRRMMSEKRQKKKVIKTSPGEPNIQVS